LINCDQNHLRNPSLCGLFSGSVDAVDDGCTGATSVGSVATDCVVEELATVANVVELDVTSVVDVGVGGSLETAATEIEVDVDLVDVDVELLVETESDSEGSEEDDVVSVEIPAGVSSDAV